MLTADKDYIIGLRRELHEYPELEFDLPRTLSVVRRELDALGIPYTEAYGKSSIVGYLNPDCKDFTIGAYEHKFKLVLFGKLLTHSVQHLLTLAVRHIC